MSRASVVLAALSAEPTSTSDLYDRAGYLALARVGLIPYEAFRDQLVALAGAGLAESEPGESGTTLWKLPGEERDHPSVSRQAAPPNRPSPHAR